MVVGYITYLLNELVELLFLNVTWFSLIVFTDIFLLIPAKQRIILPNLNILFFLTNLD